MIRNIFKHIIRFFFVLLLLTTAAGKLLDINGFAAIIGTYQLSIPDSLLLPVALGVATFELLLGLLIMSGLLLRLGASLLIAMHLGYTALAIISNLRDLTIENCGCFGVFFARPMTWTTVIEDLALVVLSISFLCLLKKKRSSDLLYR